VVGEGLLYGVTVEVGAEVGVVGVKGRGTIVVDAKVVVEDVVLVLLVLSATDATIVVFKNMDEEALDATETAAGISTKPLTQYATDANKLLQPASICVFHDLN